MRRRGKEEPSTTHVVVDDVVSVCRVPGDMSVVANDGVRVYI